MLERFESLEQKRQKIIGSKSREVKTKELSQCSRKPTVLYIYIYIYIWKKLINRLMQYQQH